MDKNVPDEVRAGADADLTPFELDLLYNEIDKLYHTYARGCGLSDCAYWMLYDLERAGGTLPLSQLSTSWSHSKQTINSALKVLQERGLVELSFLEGSRKSKQAALTSEGRAFSAERIVPAIDAEQHAFAALSTDEQAALVHLVRRYADELERQISACVPT